jgi:hypothetical protein
LTPLVETWSKSAADAAWHPSVWAMCYCDSSHPAIPRHPAFSVCGRTTTNSLFSYPLPNLTSSSSSSAENQSDFSGRAEGQNPSPIAFSSDSLLWAKMPLSRKELDLSQDGEMPLELTATPDFRNQNPKPCDLFRPGLGLSAS